jgi:cell division transport system permease protein
MTWAQAIRYFFGEALLSLRRGWRVSLLAIVTIAVSLFLGGLFALVSHNLGRQLEAWTGQARVVVYFDSSTSETALGETRASLLRLPWIEAVTLVTLEQARERFRQAFPDLADVLDDPDADPLPPSLEIRLAAAARGRALAPSRKDQLASLEGVDWIDDDRAWLDRLEGFVAVGRALGLGLGILFLVAAVFTISSVIRLVAYRYRDEIAVMRQVGATEFLIRCPFYLEGCLQGLAGGVVAAAGLWLIHGWLRPERAGSAVLTAVARDFLPPSQILALLTLGVVAGGVGAVFSLRRELTGYERAID